MCVYETYEGHLKLYILFHPISNSVWKSDSEPEFPYDWVGSGSWYISLSVGKRSPMIQDEPDIQIFNWT